MFKTIMLVFVAAAMLFAADAPAVAPEPKLADAEHRASYWRAKYESLLGRYDALLADRNLDSIIGQISFSCGPHSSAVPDERPHTATPQEPLCVPDAPPVTSGTPKAR